jgi:hypothetical protein
MKGRTIDNERGVILVIALIFLCVLAIAGSMAYQMTATELMIAKNFDASKEALYSANAGLEEARAALGLPSTNPNAIYDPATSYPDASWTAYILATSPWGFSNDPNYSSADTNYIPNSGSQTNTSITTNSLQSDLDYWVKIRHKTDGDIVYYGCENPSASLKMEAFPSSSFPSFPATAYRPVEIITAYGVGENSGSTLRAEVVYDPGPPILAALYAETDVDGDASSYTVTISGADNCTSGACPFCGSASKDDVYVYPSAADPQLDDSNTTPATTLPTMVTGDININVSQGITSMKTWKTSSSASSCYNSNYDICYSSGNLTITNQTGSGVLLVEGDLTLEGTSWNGLILTNGQLILNGGGAGIDIEGAVLVNGEVWVNPPTHAGTPGSVTINYNSCAIDAALGSIPVRILSWEDLSITE